MNPPNAYKQQQ